MTSRAQHDTHIRSTHFKVILPHVEKGFGNGIGGCVAPQSANVAFSRSRHEGVSGFDGFGGRGDSSKY